MNDDAAQPRPIEHRTPTDATVKELYATALVCGKPGCKQLLYRVSETGARVLNSEVAHIHARREGGPRWAPTMSEAANRNYDNLILLCRQHASEIDTTPEHFPADLLSSWKRAQVAAHERAAITSLALTDVEVAEVMERSFGVRELTAAIAEIVPFSPRMRSRDEALDLAARQSYARRTRRLRPVPSDRRDAVLLWMAEQNDPVVSVPEGQLRVLVAPMGAGKTEHALRWWDEGLMAAQADADVEIPVWLDARDVTAGLEMDVTTRIGRDPARRCRVVIDNLDGLSPRDAAQLLDQARELVAVWPKTSVLATARPGVSATDEELIKVEPWVVERGADLVRIVAGDVLWRVWTTETADLLTSPLTALAVAARLRAGHDVRVTRLMLLAELARTVIEDERPEQATQQIWIELARLAVRMLNGPLPVTAASFGSQPLVWQLADTGLVVNDDGKLNFALPVFEQHFGAQAIRDGLVELQAAASATAFPRWRYALASAISTSEQAEAEAYALRMAGVNPAALSWILEEISSEGGGTPSDTERSTPLSSASTETGEDSDPALLRGRWLREALQAVLGGFGTCRTELARQRDGRLVQWGVSCVDDWMFLGEARDVVPPPELVLAPYDRQEVTIASGWARWTQFRFPSGNLGRWVWARERLRRPLLDLIRRRRLPLPAGSPLARERMWVLAQRIMQITRRPWSTAIPLMDLRQAVDSMMEQVERSVHSRWHGYGEEIDSHDVRWMHAQLQRETTEMLESPQPPRDRVDRLTKWRWDGYSQELTRDIHLGVLRDAVIGYRDLVEHNFASFGGALGLNGALPVRVDGTIFAHEDDVHNSQNGLLYELRPDPEAHHGSQPRVDLELSTQTEHARNQARPERRLSRLIHNRRTTPFYVPTIYRTDLMTGLSRPATNLAYEWLATDLQALGWLTESIRFHD